MFKRMFIAAMIFGAAALAPPVDAQVANCIPREKLAELLHRDYGERLFGEGLQNSRHIIELWTSDKTGSFTVFVSRADGLSCIITTGSSWHTVPDTNLEGTMASHGR